MEWAKVKIFVYSGNMEQSAHFGWQNKDEALYGLREGYKNSADDLVEIVLKNPDDIKMLDTYIFPIMFSYRHSIEIALKHIYQRAKGEIPAGAHNLLTLWDNVRSEIIDGMICSKQFIEQVKTYKKHFVQYSLDGIKLNKVRTMLKEMQEANQQGTEVNPEVKQVDQNAEVWRYLINTDEELFFTCGHSIDYTALKEGVNYIYEVLDYIYFIVDEYLSS